MKFKFFACFHHFLPPIAVIFPLLGIAGCSTVSRRHDEMCSQIARFANSAGDHSVRSVELSTDWGGVFSNEKGVIAEKACKHDESTSGKRLCQYLMEDTSTEFAAVNFRRALSCLSGAQIYAGPPESRVEYLHGRITSYSAKGVQPDVLVWVEFSTGSDDQAPSLKIGAQKLPAP